LRKKALPEPIEKLFLTEGYDSNGAFINATWDSAEDVERYYAMAYSATEGIEYTIFSSEANVEFKALEYGEIYTVLIKAFIYDGRKNKNFLEPVSNEIATPA